MLPEICRIGPFTIYSYGLMLIVAFLVSSALVRIQAKKENINPDFIFNTVFMAFILGTIGARIFYVAENLDFYLKRPLEIIMVQHGGLSWFGGLFLGASSAILYIKIKRYPVFKILDLCVPFLALAQAIGRFGCFLNGCCFGKASATGIYFPVHRAALVPTQVYSSLMLVFIFIILRVLQKRSHRDGEIFFAYLILYSLKRFFIEFLRADNKILFHGLTLFQLISIAVFLASICAFFILKSKR